MRTHEELETLLKQEQAAYDGYCRQLEKEMMDDESFATLDALRRDCRKHISEIQSEMAKLTSHSASFLTKLLNYHRNTMFQKFCRDVYPDFKPEESSGYLSGKFGQFQYRFIAFLSELDQSRLEKLEDAISQTMETSHHGH